jgi:NAD(P)-dependent dehydrogenase (short-subunit alcohol dehydrogenase family)
MGIVNNSGGTFVVTGSGAGLGANIAQALRETGHTVIDFDRKLGHDVRDPWTTFGPPPERIDGLINCAGVNITSWLEDMTDEVWDEVLGVNAKGIYKMTQWALPPLAKYKGTVLNIVSNASHMPMTTSLAYNASKAAAHIMTLQLAHELGPKFGITVFGISPNKLAGTEMSADIERQVVALRGWTPEFARQYQLKALPAGEETNPNELAFFIAYLLNNKSNHKYLAKTILPYGA